MADLENKDTQAAVEVAEEEVKTEKAESKKSDKDKKAKAKKATPKKNKVKLGQRIKKFFKDYKSELKKVVWCTPKMTVQYTLVVIAFMVVVGGFIGILDLAFGEVLKLLGKLI